MCPLVRWVGSNTVLKRVATSTAAKKADYIPPGTIESKVDQSVVSAAGSREDSFDEDRLITRIVQGNRGTHVKTKRGLKSPACRKVSSSLAAHCTAVRVCFGTRVFQKIRHDFFFAGELENKPTSLIFMIGHSFSITMLLGENALKWVLTLGLMNQLKLKMQC